MPTLDTTISAELIREILADPTRLSLVAQPICDLRRGTVVGYELLSRFGQGLRPDHVFAAAIRHGLGEELEALVLRRAIAVAGTKPGNCFVTVNVDPLHVFAPRVREVLDEPPTLGGLVFELTEHRPTDDIKPIRRALDALRKRGAMFALDDTGSGHSGLKQLLELQPQFVKIDRDLVTDIHFNEAKRALVQMVGHLAARLDAWVLCEGIETEAECTALCQLGVPLGQGYWLGRPAPPWSAGDPVAADLLRRRRKKEHAEGGSLEGLVEPCPTVGLTDPWSDLVKMSVRIDECGRPVGFRLQTDDGAIEREESQLLKMKRGASLAEIALRAATRPERTRWDPLVCIDDLGHFQGVIPVQRLVCDLATESLEAAHESAYTTPRRRTIQPTQH